MKVGRILLPLVGSPIDEDVVRLAATIGKPVKAHIMAVHVIEVKWNMPLDAVLEDEMVRGEQLLSRAEEVGKSAGVNVETELVQARTAWAAIVDTAQQRQADLIVMGMPYRRRLGRVVIGRTVQNVFVNAACEVLALRERSPEFAAEPVGEQPRSTSGDAAPRR
jgi:nucleotide-binding universal stress UspA family protein